MGGCASVGDSSGLEVVYGPIIGDVSRNNAIVWARANKAGKLTMELSSDAKTCQKLDVSFSKDSFTGTIKLSDLKENTNYEIEIGGAKGSFKTFGGKSMKLVWGSCLGGQFYGRREESGLPLISTMSEVNPDAFVFLGDTIYADDPIPAECKHAEGWNNVDIQDYKCTTKDQIQGRYEYFLRDETYSSFLKQTPVFVTWDDHEVVNDWGGAKMQRDQPELLKAAANGFYDNWPVTTSDTPDSPCGKRIYRHIEMGLCDLFMLDARQYRSFKQKMHPSTPRPPQLTQILGDEQTEWLMEALKKSTATWKLIGLSVPMSLKTGRQESGFDSYAKNEASSELKKIFNTFVQEKIRNVVFLSGDVHFPFAFRYDLDDDSSVYEFGASPIHALPLPNSVAPDLADGLPVKSREELYSQGKFGGTAFHFGLLEIEENQIQVSFRTTSETVFSQKISVS